MVIACAASCLQERRAATVVAIELLLKGYAGARNRQYRQCCTLSRRELSHQYADRNSSVTVSGLHIVAIEKGAAKNGSARKKQS